MFNNIVVRNRNFRLLWLAQLVSFIGEGIFLTAMIWWIIQMTGSGTKAGFIISMSYLPAVLIGPFAGTLADMLRPKIMLIGADLFRAILVSVFGYLALNDLLQVNHLFILTALLSASGVFHSPTTLTVIPKVVKESEIEEAMALHTIVRDISRLVGPSLGGLIIAKWSVGHAFFSQGLCLAISALWIFLMTIENTENNEEAEEKDPVIEQLKSGLKYVWNQKVLLNLLTGFGCLNLFAAPIVLLIPLSVAKVFTQGATKDASDGIVQVGTSVIKGAVALGISEGILALGSVITGLMFVKFFGKTRFSKLLFRALTLNAILFYFIAWNKEFIMFALSLLILGGVFVSVNIAVMSMFQKTVEPEMKGRFFALVEVISYALLPIASAATGTFTDKIGVAGTYCLCGSGILALTIFLFIKLDTKKLDN
jgi:MFS family permease